ncbi:MAG: flagellar hook-basal body complex protein FliE [Betaproteobacteria bacterium]|jgi:flagellar hook-basal body complex protein FliE|nr:flagellar hook-basal body complex protein FliE [Betaproteobacteria bacterium]MBK7655522.1 flagellar hook-basal body complex protein FliE [Betaproteobacteria bacterium]MBP6646380.1 flagellar hook-basal body complex protein FliE [Burkholderiaceae bacterium]
MDLRIPSSTSAPSALRSIGTGGLSKNQAPSAGSVQSPGISNAFRNALKAVSEAQNHSDSLQKEVTMENPKVSLEETMVAIQKAQIGFQTTLHVRNRMVQAYSDIMNMQV